MSGVANRQAEDPAFEMNEALRIRDAVPERYREAFADGLGRSFGQRWGYSDNRHEILATALTNPDEHQAFSRAFAEGADATFLRPFRTP